MHRSLIRTVASCAFLALGGSVGATQPQQLDDTGWTNLSPPAGAQVFYVAANGSDSNPGTQAAPFRSVQRGYSALRDGQPDQVLLRCGDTWDTAQIGITKGCNTAGQYQVIGTYGTGPRPRLNFSVTGFRGESLGKRRVAIFGLEIVGTNAPISSGIIMLSWHDVLIEGCLIRGFKDNVVVQDLASNGSFRCLGLKVRRNVIADAWYVGAPSDGRAQGIYIGGCDGWVMEENIFDKDGVIGSMFAHNVYVHETCGPGNFVGNITARSASEGIQQRPGGLLKNNLGLENSYDFYFAGPGEVSYNVALDAKDISAALPRGKGFLIDGNTNVYNNFAGYNTLGTGWGVINAFQFRGLNGTVSGNVAYDWPDPIHQEGTCFDFDSGTVTMTNNRAYQPRGGIICERGSASINSSGNSYSTIASWVYPPFRPSATMAGWTSQSIADPNCRISNYMTSIGLSGGLTEFMAQARLQSPQNWRSEFTAPVINDWVRGRAGIPLLGGGNPPSPCYANCDGSTGTPILNANDYVCFMNRYSAGNPAANCDASTGQPLLTPNDYLCFVNKYVAGCP